MFRLFVLALMVWFSAPAAAGPAVCTVVEGCPGYISTNTYAGMNAQLTVAAVCSEHAGAIGGSCFATYPDSSYIIKKFVGTPEEEMIVGYAGAATVPYSLGGDCIHPFLLVNGTCVNPDFQTCLDASVMSNSTLGVAYEEVTVSGQVSSGASVCLGTVGTSGPSVGCTANFNLDIGYTTTAGVQVSRGTVDTQGGYVSLPCDRSASSVPKPAAVALCPAGEQMGQVNGIDSCQKYGIGTKSTTTDSTGTKTDVDGDHTTKTSTECLNNSCTTKTVETNTTTGVSSTSNTVVTKTEFCSSNPSSLQCGGTGGTGGGGESGGECLPGDTTLRCTELGAPGEVTPLSNENKPLSITKDTGWGPSTGTCPAPRNLVFAFATIPVPWDMFCTFADGIRPLIIGMAYLGAAFTFFGIGRKT